MFNHIIWATDGSEHADRAFDVACRLAREGGGRLHAVHVVEKVPVPWAAGENVYLNEADLKVKVKGLLHLAHCPVLAVPPGQERPRFATPRGLTASEH